MLEPSFRDETWALKQEYRQPNGKVPSDLELRYILERQQKDY
jgi:hypothetical protein